MCRINYKVEVYTTCSWDIAVKHHTIFQFASIETRHSVTFRGKWSLISMLQDFLGEFWLLQRWNVNLILQSIFTLSFNLCTVTPVHNQIPHTFLHIFPMALARRIYLWPRQNFSLQYQYNISTISVQYQPDKWWE